jgi:hypothetical protein
MVSTGTGRKGGGRGGGNRETFLHTIVQSFTFLMSGTANYSLLQAAFPETGYLSVLRKLIVNLFLLVICLYTLSLINISQNLQSF